MATKDEAEQALLDGIEALAKQAAQSNSGTVTQQAAEGAKDLAEAYAWLRVPNQTH